MRAKRQLFVSMEKPVKTPRRYDKQALKAAIERAQRDSKLTYGAVVRFGWFYVEPDSHPRVLDMLYLEAIEFIETTLPDYLEGKLGENGEEL